MDLSKIHEELVKLNGTVERIAEKAANSERRLDFMEGKLVALLIAICGALLAKLFL